jgi:preprotein translocase subunit SecF
MVFLYALLSLTDPSDVAPGFSFTQALGAILGWLFSAYIAQTVICGLILFPMWRDRQRREEEQRMTRLQSL